MEISIEVPQDIAVRWQTRGNVVRDVLEGAALEAYRKRIIGESRLQQWLGFETRFEVHAFLKEHGVPAHYTLDDLEHDRHTHDQLVQAMLTRDAVRKTRLSGRTPLSSTAKTGRSTPTSWPSKNSRCYPCISCKSAWSMSIH